MLEVKGGPPLDQVDPSADALVRCEKSDGVKGEWDEV